MTALIRAVRNVRLGRQALANGYTTTALQYLNLAEWWMGTAAADMLMWPNLRMAIARRWPMVRRRVDDFGRAVVGLELEHRRAG